MKIILKRAVILGGKRLGVGRHELPDSVAEEWMFKAFVKDGHIDIVGEAPPEGGEEEKSPGGGTGGGDPAGEEATDLEAKPQGNNRKRPT